MKTKLEIIKEKVIEAVPEIMELKFGCAWKDNQADWVYVERFSITTSQKGGWTSVPPDPEQILGRPITLADVLLTIAFGKTVGFIRTDTGLIEIDQNPSELLSLWNLKENLENQSEETIEFLYNLIKE